MVEQKKGQAIRCPVCGTHISDSYVGVEKIVCKKCKTGIGTFVVGHFVVRFPWNPDEIVDCVKEIDSCIEQMQNLKNLL